MSSTKAIYDISHNISTSEYRLNKVKTIKYNNEIIEVEYER